MNSNSSCRRISASGGKTRMPVPADDDAVAGLHRGHRHAAGRAALGVDHDAAVHLLVLDVDPLAAEPDLGAEVGGAVEALGERAVHVGRRRCGSRPASTGTAPCGWISARIASSCSARVGAHLDAGVAGVVLPLAELQRLDVVPAAARQDLVEHLRQQQRIDDVARSSRRTRRAARTWVNLREQGRRSCSVSS